MAKQIKRKPIDPWLQEIGQNLRELRLGLDLTQVEVAEILGYSSHSAISNIEGGHCAIGLLDLRNFAELYEINPGDLLPEFPLTEEAKP